MIIALLLAAATFQPDTAAALHRLQPLLDAKRYDEAIELIESAMTHTASDSYDRLFLADTDAKIRLEYHKDDVVARTLFQEVVTLAETHPGYLSPRDIIQRYSYLAHFCYQLGVDAKDASVRQADFDEAIGWMKRGPRLNSEDANLYCVLLYQQATAAGGKVDRTKMEAALAATQQAMASSHGKSTEQLLAAEYVALGQYPEAAETFERMLQKNPAQKTTWGQLFGVYNNLAANSKADPKLQRAYWTRAISTIERAQALGFLTDKNNNYNLVTLYYTTGNYRKAADLLRTGMEHGTIEDKPDNWASLGYFVQQSHDSTAAIAALKEGVRHFPDDSDLYFQIAQEYVNDSNAQESYSWFRQAIEHHHFRHQKEGMAEYQLGYAAYELKRYDEALAAVNAALNMPDTPKANLQNFKRGIEDAIRKQSTEGKESSL